MRCSLGFHSGISGWSQDAPPFPLKGPQSWDVAAATDGKLLKGNDAFTAVAEY